MAQEQRTGAAWPAGALAGPGEGDDSPGGDRAGGSGMRAGGHDGVSRRCPGHLPPTASVAALLPEALGDVDLIALPARPLAAAA
jgi:hypothetical protein